MGTTNRNLAQLPPADGSNDEEWKRIFSRWMLEANQGHLQNTGNVTLTVGSTFTTVQDSRAAAASFISFMPTTSHAAQELAAGTMFVSAQGKRFFTISHTNNAFADRTFTYKITG